MITIAICDDCTAFTTELEKLINYYGKLHSIKIMYQIYFDGDALLKDYNNGVRYDLIYLDIEMRYINGIEAGHYIREMDETVLIIFVSSHENYMKELFEVEPFRFISKPIDKRTFEKYLLNAYERVMRSDGTYIYRYNKIYHQVKVKDIKYFESNRREILIVMLNGVERFYGKLDEVEKALEKYRFLRIHKSFLVNEAYIKKIAFSYIVLFDGTNLRISQNKQKIIRKNLICKHI